MSESKPKRIIIDEEKEALRLLSADKVFFDYGALRILSKYYFSLGLQPSEVKKQITKYLQKVEFYNETFYEADIDNIIKKARFYKLKRADLKIAITKKEVDVLKVLNHKDYRVALYMLFLAKAEKYQSIKKGQKKTKSFKTFLNHDIKSCAYAVGVSLNSKQTLQLGRRLYLAGVIEPILLENTLIITCASDDKKIEFVIDGKEDFLSQIKYYCVKCGEVVISKRKYHDLCDNCYKEKVREKDRLRKSSF